MKKLLTVFITICLFAILALPVSAYSGNKDDELAFSFQFVFDANELSNNFATGPRGIIGEKIYVPVNGAVSKEIGTTLVLELSSNQALAATTTKNVSVKGHFYLIEDPDTIVTRYGLAGSFESDGSSVKISGEYAYHNSALDNWSGNSATSQETGSGYKTLIGTYEVFKKNKKDNSAEIKVKGTKNGVITVSGDYTEKNIS